MNNILSINLEEEAKNFIKFHYPDSRTDIYLQMIDFNLFVKKIKDKYSIEEALWDIMEDAFDEYLLEDPISYFCANRG